MGETRGCWAWYREWFLIWALNNEQVSLHLNLPRDQVSKGPKQLGHSENGKQFPYGWATGKHEQGGRHCKRQDRQGCKDWILKGLVIGPMGLVQNINSWIESWAACLTIPPVSRQRPSNHQRHGMRSFCSLAETRGVPIPTPTPTQKKAQGYCSAEAFPGSRRNFPGARLLPWNKHFSTQSWKSTSGEVTAHLQVFIDSKSSFPIYHSAWEFPALGLQLIQKRVMDEVSRKGMKCICSPRHLFLSPSFCANHVCVWSKRTKWENWNGRERKVSHQVSDPGQRKNHEGGKQKVTFSASNDYFPRARIKLGQKFSRIQKLSSTGWEPTQLEGERRKTEVSFSEFQYHCSNLPLKNGKGLCLKY